MNRRDNLPTKLRNAIQNQFHAAIQTKTGSNLLRSWKGKSGSRWGRDSFRWLNLANTLGNVFCSGAIQKGDALGSRMNTIFSSWKSTSICGKTIEEVFFIVQRDLLLFLSFKITFFETVFSSFDVNSNTQKQTNKQKHNTQKQNRRIIIATSLLSQRGARGLNDGNHPPQKKNWFRL